MSLWLIGGVDPTGGAGLLRDAWAARRSAAELEFHCVATALTRQGHGRPARAYPVAPARFVACMDRLPAPSAIKLGMLPDPLIAPTMNVLERYAVPIVIDPVIAATDGGPLGAEAKALVPVLRGASLVTPNRAEAEQLADAVGATSTAQLRARLGVEAVLFKAVEAAGDIVRDVLVTGDGEQVYARPRDPGPDPRGTGCALATAIACGLARGTALGAAVGDAIAWLDRARADTVPGPDGRAHMV